MYGAFGIPAVTTAQMEDFAQVHAAAVARQGDLQPRRTHRQVPGPVPRSRLQGEHPAGPRRVRSADTLALGGRAFDDVILHTYFTAGDAAARA